MPPRKKHEKKKAGSIRNLDKKGSPGDRSEIKQEDSSAKEEGYYCIYCGYYVKPGEYHHH